MANIIVKKYEHYNEALGKHIRSKAHYEAEMNKGGFIPYEKAQAIAEKRNKELIKEYKPSAKALEIMRTVKNSADKKGNLKLSDRTVEALKSIGALKNTGRSFANMSHIKGGFEK